MQDSMYVMKPFVSALNPNLYRYPRWFPQSSVVAKISPTTASLHLRSLASASAPSTLKTVPLEHVFFVSCLVDFSRTLPVPEHKRAVSPASLSHSSADPSKFHRLNAVPLTLR
uniref:(northern house mosquito) hypothetical protein n=1 Tax=Culex pipiens TaxID=7175 RepID=A0A8D8FMC6_CULPI